MKRPDSVARARTALRRLGHRLAALVIALGVLAPMVLFSPASADQNSDQQQLAAARAALADIQKKLQASRGQAAVIQNQVNALNKQIDALNRQIGVDTQAGYNLKTNIDTDNAKIAALEAQYSSAQQAADTRARQIYEAGPASSLASLLSAHSLTEFIRDTLVWQVSSQLDSQVIIHSARLKQSLTVEQQDLSTAEAAYQAKEGALQGKADLLNSAVGQRNTALDVVNQQIVQEEQQAAQEQQTAEDLTNALENDAQLSRGTGNVSVSGLIWPVRGPINSPFGPRRGGFHYGIDIGASTGTPIHAAEAGTVLGISCGSGYGICTIIDHGGGVATLYAHMSRKIIDGGSVSQGEVIGDVGCTGECTGPHLHFEVRINGVPKNPQQYLP